LIIKNMIFNQKGYNHVEFNVIRIKSNDSDAITVVIDFAF